MMRKEIKNFSRYPLFKIYHERTNPFFFVTTKIEITKLYQLCKKNKNTYATIGYYFTKALNQVDAFKYRYEEGKFYQYDIINPNFTQMFSHDEIGYFTVDMKSSYQDFILEYQKVENKFLKSHQSIASNDQAVVWLSCEPWFHFTSCVVPFYKKVTIPQLIWDQFEIVKDRCYLNLMIMGHHGFIDGFHIGKLIQKIKEEIESIEI